MTAFQVFKNYKYKHAYTLHLVSCAHLSLDYVETNSLFGLAILF